MIGGSRRAPRQPGTCGGGSRMTTALAVVALATVLTYHAQRFLSGQDASLGRACHGLWPSGSGGGGERAGFFEAKKAAAILQEARGGHELDHLLEVTEEDLAMHPNPYKPPNPRACNMSYCSLRYAPPARQYSWKERQRQWALVSDTYGLRIVHANDKARAASRAYVTMITGGNTDYAMGALVLAHSLRAHNTTYPIVALVSDNGQALFGLDSMGAGGGGAPVDEAALAWRRALLEEFDMVVRVPTMEGGSDPNLLEKLFMLSLVMFDRIAWLGSDTLPVMGADDILECKPPCSVYDMHLWRMDATAAIVNGDVVVVQPDLKDLAKLLFIAAPEHDSTSREAAYAHSDRPPYDWFGPADQGVLNTYYRRHWTVLPKAYHFQLGMAFDVEIDAVNYEPGVTRIIHFASFVKPWTHRNSLSDALWCPVQDALLAAHALPGVANGCMNRDAPKVL